jgi:hypothetical protein
MAHHRKKPFTPHAHGTNAGASHHFVPPDAQRDKAWLNRASSQTDC